MGPVPPVRRGGQPRFWPRIEHRLSTGKACHGKAVFHPWPARDAGLHSLRRETKPTVCASDALTDRGAQKKRGNPTGGSPASCVRLSRLAAHAARVTSFRL